MKRSVTYGGHSQVSTLRRALVCPPEAAGWSDPERRRRWRRLAYDHPPDGAAAEAEHRLLRRALEAAGAEVLELPPGNGLTLDALYPRDTSLVTDAGVIRLRMGKAERRGESGPHEDFFASLGIPELGRLEAPATAEAGDLVWLDAKTLLAGRSYRTNAAGVGQLRDLLAPLGAEVLPVPIPHGEGPEVCLHLGSLLSPVGDSAALIDRSWLAVETVEELERRGFELIDIDPAERSTHAGNVLALGPGRLLAFAENPRTNRRLQEADCEVVTIPGAEIGINGGGGPTCLVCPILRA